MLLWSGRRCWDRLREPAAQRQWRGSRHAHAHEHGL